MQCSQCQFENPPEMKFCGQCGIGLRLLCASCGVELPPNFKFCGQCGAAVEPLSASAPPSPPSQAETTSPAVLLPDSATEPSPPPTPPEGERKEVTALGCKLAFEEGSGSPPDPEQQLSLASRFSELARIEVERFGGFVQQFSGQSFLALFGAPVALEDHARRAVLAARELVANVAEEAPVILERHGVRWSAQAGIDTGPVVISGGGEVAVGEAIDHAERLQSLAEPGTLLVSGETRKLVAPSVRLESRLDEAGAVSAWQVIGTGAALDGGSPFREETLSPFVGRSRELAVLGELREEAEAGRGQVVGIVGEAGAGKSRLAYEFRKTFRDGRMSHLQGECLSYGSGVPYLPLADMIRRASKITAADDAVQITAKLRTVFDSVGTDLESLPKLLRLLGVREGTESLGELEPQALQKQTFAAMRRVILDASRRSLVVLELEDLHWIDKTSEEFLASLVEAAAAARVLLLLTYRSGYQPRWLDRSYATQITARRLSPADSRAVAAAILDASPVAELTDEVIDEAVGRAEGNPFFLEELARSLAERTSGDEAAIPNTVQGILTARIDRLPETHKRLLKTASVLGREFALELLQELWDRPEPLAPILEELQHWEFLYRAPIEDRVVYGFRHSLTQEVAYQSLLTTRRRTLHARAAAALEALHADRLEDVYDRLIYHYPRADEPQQTVHYLTLFAARAARDNAHREAAQALREALEQAGRLPVEVRDRRQVELLLRLAESLFPLARFPETLERFEHHIGCLDRLDDPSLSAQYHFWLAHTHTYLGNQQETRHHAKSAIEAAGECGDEATEGKAYYVLGRDQFWAGELEEGLEHSRKAVALLERRGEPWWQGQAYWVAGFHHFMLSQHDAALEALERARDIGEALDDYRLDTSWSLGYMYAALGEPEKGIEECQRGLERMQDPLNTAVAMGFLGYAYLEQGEIQTSIKTLREAIEQLEGTGMQQILGWFLAFLGEAHLRVGQPEEAGEIARRGVEISRQARFQVGVELAERTLEEIAQSHDVGS